MNMLQKYRAAILKTRKKTPQSELRDSSSTADISETFSKGAPTDCSNKSLTQTQILLMTISYFCKDCFAQKTK